MVLVRFYEGVVELCLYAALKRDPQGLALHFYRNGEPRGDVQGEEALIARYYLDFEAFFVNVENCLQIEGNLTRGGPFTSHRKIFIIHAIYL